MTELTESLPEDLCPSCYEGHLKEARHEHISELPDGRRVTVADLACTACDQCGVHFYPAESTGRIEAAVQKALGSLSPDDVQRFVKMTGMEEDELCERLGLGAKTIYRWRRGAQRPSKSLSILLAIIARHPRLLEWVAAEGWKQDSSADTAPFYPRGEANRRQVTPPPAATIRAPRFERRESLGIVRLRISNFSSSRRCDATPPNPVASFYQLAC